MDCKDVQTAQGKIHTVKQNKTVQQVDLSRRRFVRYTTMGVSAYAFGGAAYGMIKHDAYKIEHKDIVIENLPAELKGTTITLVSDIHSGQYMNEAEMREYADIINSLGSDIVCILAILLTAGLMKYPAC